jgi:iron(III) transport system substrate-binding protein
MESLMETAADKPALTQLGTQYSVLSKAMGLLVLTVASLLSGCWSASENEVVSYTALDSEFSEPIFDEFSTATGIEVLAKFDTEATKTVGLAQAIIAERGRPRADIFWNNEILNTLRLARQGLLEPYQPANASRFPEMYRSKDHLWHGFAGRARVLVVNTEIVPEEDRPDSILAFTEAKWKGRAAIAKPLFGTTATHAACLFSYWGEEKAKEFFRRMKENGVQILAGNKQVALAVAGGQAAFGITDTDDAIIEVEKGRPIAIVYPDQGEDEMGTLFIPNTVGIIKGAPHVASAQRLVDYLLSPHVEAKLAVGLSAQIPLGSGVDAKPRVETPETVKAMQVDFEDAAHHWEGAAEFIRDEFTVSD